MTDSISVVYVKIISPPPLFVNICPPSHDSRVYSYTVSPAERQRGRCPRTPAKEAEPLWTLIPKSPLPIYGEGGFCIGIPKGLCPLGGSLRAEPSISFCQRYHVRVEYSCHGAVDKGDERWYNIGSKKGGHGNGKGA